MENAGFFVVALVGLPLLGALLLIYVYRSDADTKKLMQEGRREVACLVHCEAVWAQDDEGYWSEEHYGTYLYADSFLFDASEHFAECKESLELVYDPANPAKVVPPKHTSGPILSTILIICFCFMPAMAAIVNISKGGG